MQRTRLTLPYLRDLGWEPTVLAVAPESVEGAVIDEILLRTYPADIRIIRVVGLPARLTRWLGIGSLWWRCGRALRTAGDKLLGGEKFDLVFFSTTQFDAFTLGPRWRRRFGIPYVLDYQDPWVNDYYRDTATRPPGGPVKFWFSQFNASRREPRVLRSASGLIAVSTAYGPSLQKRYPWFSSSEVKTIPFGTSQLDLEIARHHQPADSLVPFGDGHVHHVYAGRCGADMILALTVFFRAFRSFLSTHPAEAGRHRFHFIGTDYAPPPLGRYWVLPMAEREGVAAHVAEHCYRVPYFDALHYLTQADALVVVGSDDPTYSASKIFPYLLAKRPLIAVIHEQSPLVGLLNAQGISSCYSFGSLSDTNAIAERIHNEWFVTGGYRHTNETSDNISGVNSARAMTSELVGVFNRAVSAASQIQ